MSVIKISSLQESELQEAENLLKLAFGTFKQLPNPLEFGQGAQYSSRWYRDSSSVIAAKLTDQLIGYVMLANWGSFGNLGPIVVHPNYWNQGIASQLMQSAENKFAQWKTRQMGLSTFANSPKHVYLYGKFGYQPRFLIALMVKPITPTRQSLKAQRYSQLATEQQAESLREAYWLTDSIYAGLDLSSEIKVVEKCCLGDTIFLWNDGGLTGLAICHYEKKSEAQKNSCYIKFAAAKSPNAFEQLVDECEILASNVFMISLVAGVDTACEDAYQRMLARKYKIQTFMLSMYKPNQPSYTRQETYIIDDRR